MSEGEIELKGNPGSTGSDTAHHLRIELHGIDYIPEHERWAKPRDLFAMWAGASFQVEYFVYGIALMTFGFSFSQALILTVIGNCSFVLVGVASLQGPIAGTTAMTINRAPFGSRGARLIAVFNWLTQIGFETEGLILIVLAAEVLAERGGVHVGSGLKMVFILFAVAIQLLVPLFGHETLIKTLRALAVPFLALYIILAAYIIPKAHFHSVVHVASWSTWLAGLAFTVALSGLGWTENGNDYSRYLPEDAKRSSIIAWVFLGSGVPQTLVMIIGIMVGTYTTTIATSANPFSAFANAHVVPTAFVVPVLVVSIVQLFAINSLDLYSSGVTLQTIGFSLKRWQAVIVDTCVTGILTVYAVFDATFNTLLKDFADIVIIWIGPWFAIYILDWAMRRYRYDSLALQQVNAGSRYYGSFYGLRPAAVFAQLLGMFAALEGLSPTFSVPSWLNLVAAHTHGADVSIFSGAGVAGIVYFLLVRKEFNKVDDESKVDVEVASS
ncbi:MAG TPA: cytosine permease [Acidimicrobiales bacterium]|nr:cytosine permease [Acidimicrobiales bacterium]